MPSHNFALFSKYGLVNGEICLTKMAMCGRSNLLSSFKKCQQDFVVSLDLLINKRYFGENLLMIETQLTAMGLNETETKTYLCLLSFRSVPASVVARHAQLVRSTAKYTCEQLVKKGLAHTSLRKRTVYYSPNEPKNLLLLLQKERLLLAQKEQILTDLIPVLQTQFEREEFTPKTQIFEGAEGLIEMLRDSLYSHAPLYGALFLPEQLHPLIEDFFENEYKIERKKHPAPAWMIFNNNERSQQYRQEDPKMNRISLLVSTKEYPLAGCLHIYGNKVAFFSYEKDVLSGVLIQDLPTHALQSSLFKLAWNHARELPENQNFKKVDLDY